MDKVCCAIEAHGFTLNGEFKPKEIAIVSHKLSLSVLCDIDYKKKTMSWKEKKSVSIISEMTGLPLDSKDDNYWRYEPKYKPKEFDGVNAIVAGYNWIRTDEQPVVATKTPQLVPIFEMFDIPYILMDPKENSYLNNMYNYFCNTNCIYHKHNNTKCAYYKAQGIWYIVKSKKLRK